jgi:hypothetical protein
VLGFSHIAWALSRVTKGDGRENILWGKEQQRAFNDMKHLLCSTLVLSLLDLQQQFKIETHAFDYVVGAVLIQNGHLVAYHSETLSETVRKYPTYDKEMYSIVKSCRQWKHYILGKDTIIHIDHNPLQFIETKEKLQNNHHQKCSKYLQKFHINIKYKIGISNRVASCLSRPLIAALTTMLHSCGHEVSEWPQLYQQYIDFSTTYQLLGIGTIVTDFHIQDKLLCHMDHLCVPTSEHANFIWETHYSWMSGHFGVEKIVFIL